jgi:hypothetical protein
MEAQCGYCEVGTWFLGITRIKFMLRSHKFKQAVTVMRGSLEKRFLVVMCVAVGSYQLCAVQLRIVRKSEQLNAVVG